MNAALYIAKRYLFSKKSRNAINIISAISLVAVMAGTCALVIIISVFNGFDDLITSLYNRFDPDIRITATNGKTMNVSDSVLSYVTTIPGTEHMHYVIEDIAMIRHNDRTYFAVLKGVQEGYLRDNTIDSSVVEGIATLQTKRGAYALMGQGIAYYLGINIGTAYPMEIYVPGRSTDANAPLESIMNRKLIFPCGIFAAEQEIDSKYMFVPYAFAQDIFDYKSSEATAIEIRLKKNADLKKTKKLLLKHIAPVYSVKTRYELNDSLYRVMQSEKLAIFFILSFILMIASFNIIGSLTMLIIDKKTDIETLTSLGASKRFIRNIFLLEGWLISLIGATCGVLIGLLVCWLQMTFEFVKLKGSESFIIDHYPVSIEWLDIVLILCTVLLIGFFAAWYPVKYISRKLHI